MTELVDNLTQLLAALSGCVLSGVLYLRSRRQPYFLLCCFYGCFGMGLLYWLLYTLLITDAPPMFRISGGSAALSFCFCCSTALWTRRSVCSAAGRRGWRWR